MHVLTLVTTMFGRRRSLNTNVELYKNCLCETREMLIVLTVIWQDGWPSRITICSRLKTSSHLSDLVMRYSACAECQRGSNCRLEWIVAATVA